MWIIRKIAVFLIVGIVFYIAFSSLLNYIWNEPRKNNSKKTGNSNEITKQEDAARIDEKRKQQLVLYLALFALAFILEKRLIL